MSYTSEEGLGWRDIDVDDLPDLDTEESRNEWVEILMSQDDDSLVRNDSGWCKALIVADDRGNMVARIVYPNGAEEVFDLTIRRSIDVSTAVEERN